VRLSRALAPIIVAAAVAGCSAAAASPSPSAAQPSVMPSAAASVAAGGGYGAKYGDASSASPASGFGGLALAQTSLGGILVGPGGMTLYMFVPDTSTSSSCTGACAATWPPLTGALPSLGAGLDASSFGTIDRGDGTKQVTFHGHPLYFFSGDKAAGDTNGQALNSKWYVLGADGNPIK
jgi:predicted lipoprotein with Yx(FWY)xxD motif